MVSDKGARPFVPTFCGASLPILWGWFQSGKGGWQGALNPLGGPLEGVRETVQQPSEELAEQLPEAAQLHGEERGKKESGKLEWVWVIRSALARVFRIGGKGEAKEWSGYWGKGRGILLCDFWGA